MKKIKKYFILSILSIMFTSCGKDFLNMEPSNAISVETAFKDAESMEVALTGVYSSLQSSDYYGRSFLLIPELMADNLFLSGKTTVHYYTVFDKFIVDKYDSFVNDSWKNIYKTANNAARVITGGEKLIAENSENLEKIEQFTGEAYALRALAHFDLVRLYAQPYNYTADASHLGVPLISEVSNVPEYPARNTVAESFNLIITDLQKAIEYMNEETKDGSFSVLAAKALLSRVYLYKEDWDNVISASTEIINSGEYSLISNSNFIASWSQDFNDETLFEVINNKTDNAGTGSIGYFFDKNGYGFGLVTADLKYSYTATDIRAGLIETGMNPPTEITAYFVKKYPAGANNTDNIKILRLAEVYLNRAEAYANKNKPAEALEDLNQVVERADPSATVSGISGQDLIDRILLERRKELAFEGHRLFDLNRNKKNVDIINKYETVHAEYPNDRFILPIPHTEISSNSNMVQNPGY